MTAPMISSVSVNGDGLVQIIGLQLAPVGAWVQVEMSDGYVTRFFEGPWVSKSLGLLRFYNTDTALYGRSLTVQVVTPYGTSEPASTPLQMPYPPFYGSVGGFQLFTEADQVNPLPIGCAVSVDLPLEHKDFSQYYTVQRDNGTYSSGTYVDPTSLAASTETRMRLVIDRLDAASMIQQFFMDNASFYIQCGGLDLFSTGELGAKHHVNLIAYEMEPRTSPIVWESLLAIKKVSP